MEWYMAAMKKYADFNGRARRKEYWMFALVQVGIYLALMVVSVVLAKVNSMLGAAAGVLVLLWAVAHIVPGLAVGVRRLHDTGKSGWLLLIGLVPLIGGIVLLVFFCQDSAPAANEFGESPKVIGEPLVA